MVNDQLGTPALISADAPSVFLSISKIIKIRDGGQKLVVEIQKLLCGGRKTKNLIESTFLNLNICQVHMFYLKLI